MSNVCLHSFHFSNHHQPLDWPIRTATVKVFEGERLMAKNNHLCLGSITAGFP